jgi:hypothetical protein
VTAIVWIVRPGDENESLRYSMRSVWANLPHTSAWIAGHKPSWVSDLVHHRPAVQNPGDRHGNVRRNIEQACHSLDRWILMWDDVYVMRPMTELPIYTAGPLDQVVARIRRKDGASKHADDIEAAGKVCRVLGIDEPSAYDALHLPQHIHSETMLHALRATATTNCVLTLHGNMAGLGGTVVHNAKRATGWREADIVSTSEKRFKVGDEGRHVRATFPEACPYEA